MRRLSIALVVAGLALAACAKESAPPRAARPPRAFPAASPAGTGTAARQSEVKYSFEDKLPEGFPSDLPLPKGAKVLASAASGDASVVFFSAPGSTAEIRDFFAAELPKAGWVLSTCQTTPVSPEPVAVIIASKARLVASAAIGYIPQITQQPQLKKLGKYSFYLSVVRSPNPLPSPSGSPAKCA